MTQPSPFFGKHRGTVLDNVDPLLLGRVLVSVAARPEALANWALPCTPFPAPGHVAAFTVPPVGAHVWIEFEAGNPGYPIWSGCFWLSGEAPLLAAPETNTSPTP